MKIFLSLLLAIAICVNALVPSLKRDNGTSMKMIPSQVSTGDVIASFLSSDDGFDGPKLSAINRTSFDWWYFDAVSTDLKTAIAIVFTTTLSTGFPYVTTDPDVTAVGVFYSFANGTTGVIGLPASGATVTTIDDGSQGYFNGIGASWIGTPDMSYYQVHINAPEYGVVGLYQVKSKAPAHCPCAAVGAGQTLEVAPHIGWANAIPDGDGKADLTILGSELRFDGAAYHDKNWSDQPFQTNVASWYWGHGRLGPYSIVWFDTLAPNGTEYVSGYAAKDGEIISASCDPTALKVRPVDSAYPPFIHTPDPDAYTIVLDMGAEGVLSVNLTIGATIVEVSGTYKRWTGSMKGSVDGGLAMTGGVAMLEQFKMVP